MTTKTIYNEHEIAVRRVKTPMGLVCYEATIDGQTQLRRSTKALALSSAKAQIKIEQTETARLSAVAA